MCNNTNPHVALNGIKCPLQIVLENMMCCKYNNITQLVVIIMIRYDEELALADAREKEVERTTDPRKYRIKKTPTWK